MNLLCKNLSPVYPVILPEGSGSRCGTIIGFIGELPGLKFYCIKILMKGSLFLHPVFEIRIHQLRK